MKNIIKTLSGDKQILLTGGAGFIGSCCIKYLNERGIYNIVVVDDLGQSEKWKNLVGKSITDIINKKNCFEWLNANEDSIGSIIHLGACSSTVETDCNYLLENNYRFSQNLALFACKNNIRFIYASSAATYGDGSNGFDDDHDRLESLKPLNMYGFSKHLFDLWVKRQGLLDRVVGLKYFNVYGPNEWHKGRMASAVVHFIPTAKKEGVIRLFKSSEPDKFADGGQCRDFIYVKDAVRMTCAFLENDVTGIYNIGSGWASTWNQLAISVFKAIQMPVNIQYISMPPDLVGKYQNYTCANMNKAERALKGLAATMPLENAVIDYIRHYLLLGNVW